MATARSLLKSMHVPGSMWDEAVRHAVCLLNRLPMKALCALTPYEAWNGKKLQLEHLKVFECMAHVRVAGPHHKKLDDRSTPMMYLGVEEGSKAHSLFDPRHGKIHVSRDVVFEEGKRWEWSIEGGEDLHNWVEISVMEDGADGQDTPPTELPTVDGTGAAGAGPLGAATMASAVALEPRGAAAVTTSLLHGAATTSRPPTTPSTPANSPGSPDTPTT